MSEVRERLWNGEVLRIQFSGDVGFDVWVEKWANPPRVFCEGRARPLEELNAVLKDVEEYFEQDGVRVIEPNWHFGLSEETAKSYERAALVRFFIHDYLPEYDYSLWLDPDLWLQDSGVLDRMLDGAEKTGAAIAHESDRLYSFQAWLWAWNLKHKIVGSGLWRGPARETGGQGLSG